MRYGTGALPSLGLSIVWTYRIRGLKGLRGQVNDCILLRDNGLEKDFQTVPCTSAQFGQESPVIEEGSPYKGGS